MYEFKLPDLGEGIHEGEILKWYVTVGDTIQEDDPLVDVETDKAAVTIPSPKSGKVEAIHGDVGETVSVGQIVVVIDDGSVAKTPDAPAKKETKKTASPQETPKKPTSPPTTATPTVGPVIAAPATRRLARQLGVNLKLIQGSGPAGRITAEDVRAFTSGEAGTPSPEEATLHVDPKEAAGDPSAQAKYAAHAASVIPFLDLETLPDFTQFGSVEIEPLRSIRRKVAHKMVTSMVLVPHVAHMDEADVTDLEEFRESEKKRRSGQPGGKMTLLAFMVKAVTAGLRAAPAFNASLDPFKEEIIYKKYYNIGIAVDTGRGLIVPVVKGTECKSILQLATDIENLAEKARNNELNVNDLRGGTFTITNIGPLGGTALIPTINYPEVAILGMGKIQEKPVVRDGKIVIRKILPLTLSFDHRIADGADAARFVSEMIRQLSDPNLLLLET